MRVLVTGGSGFLGAAVVRALIERGDTAIAFDTKPAAGTRSDERLVRIAGDVTDPAGLMHSVLDHEPEAVIHCAAIVGVLSSLGNPAAVARVNIEG